MIKVIGMAQVWNGKRVCELDAREREELAKLFKGKGYEISFECNGDERVVALPEEKEEKTLDAQYNVNGHQYNSFEEMARHEAGSSNVMFRKNVRQVIVQNGKIIIDGVEQEKTDAQQVFIIVEGNVTTVHSNGGTIQINGNVDTLHANGSDVVCRDVNGNVHANAGSVRAVTIKGDVKATMGTIHYEEK